MPSLKPKCIALFSGGLDSSLAIKLIQAQGIEVEAVFFDIGFGLSPDKFNVLEKRAKELGCKLTILDIRKQFINEVLFDPKYGYGKNLNPCIDCHANMIRRALKYMKKAKAKFIITGEVLGERPMSQRKDALETVEKNSGAKGLLLRPLSAKLLEPTIPEQKGWVDREQLLDIEGRSRERQLQLVETFKLKNYATPGGGCLLTDESFSKRVSDFVKDKALTIDDLPIVKVGRHLRLPGGAKLIIARNEKECHVLESYKLKAFTKLIPKDFTGPSALLSAKASQEDKELTNKLIKAYSKGGSHEERQQASKYFIV